MITSGQKCFFVCVGAQKSGTSWLHKYLRSSSKIFLPDIKEMHFFDTKFMPQYLVGDYWLQRFRADAKRCIDAGSYNRARCYIDRLKIGTSTTRYKRFYESKLRRYQVVGDITPAYSMLEDSGFEAIKGIHRSVKIIFLMRNPIDRYWSFLRMQLKKNPSYNIEEKFYEVIDKPHVSLRSDYERTILTMERVFSKNDIQLIFFEDLFGPDQVQHTDRIAEFLGLDPFPSDSIDHIVNASHSIPISDDLRLFAYSKFKRIYQFVSERMGYLPQCWQDDIGRYA